MNDQFKIVMKKYFCSRCGHFSVIHDSIENTNKRCFWCKRFVKCIGVEEFMVTKVAERRIDNG